MLSTQSLSRWAVYALLALASCMVSSGCGPDPSPADAAVPRDGECTSGRIEVGGSAGRFLPLPPSGGAIDIVRGPQGGIHVLVGFRITDLPIELTATYRLRDPATGVDAAPPTLRALGPGLYRVDGTGLVRIDDLIVLDNATPRVEDFAGRDFSLEVEALTATGICARDARLVMLR